MSTLNASAGASAAAMKLADAFGQFGPAYMKWLRAGSREKGLTLARIRLLGVLSHSGSQIMSSLSEELCVTARSVTALVDALEADGLVRRTPHPRDRRATIVELTEAGETVVKEQFEEHRSRAATLFAQLDGNEQRELLRLTRRLTDELSRLASVDPSA